MGTFKSKEREGRAGRRLTGRCEVCASWREGAPYGTQEQTEEGAEPASPPELGTAASPSRGCRGEETPGSPFTVGLPLCLIFLPHSRGAPASK